MQFKHEDESGTGERQGSLEKDSLRQAQGRRPQSGGTEPTNDGTKGARQSEVQAIGSDTSPEERQDDE